MPADKPYKYAWRALCVLPSSKPAREQHRPDKRPKELRQAPATTFEGGRGLFCFFVLPGVFLQIWPFIQ